jgi:hypothetical protein
MNPSTQRALDRLLRKMERAQRRKPRRFSTAPLMLLLGLIVGYQLLVRLVPRVWATMLPGGWEQANTFRGWPGIVWALALACHQHFAAVAVIIGGTTLFAFVLIRIAPLFRFPVWLVAVGVILLDAGILYITLRTSLEAVAPGVLAE